MIQIKKWAIKFIATGFFSGYSPLIPGTTGSLAGVLVYLSLKNLKFPYYLLFLVLLFFFGVWVSKKAEDIFQEKDSKKIVIDEIVGFLMAVFLLPFKFKFIIFSFILFRLFDWWKPFPIRSLERLKGGWGIMLDDLLAGIYTNVVLQIYRLIIR
jgi:phosphatidylglycerophosphatase A